MKNKHLIQGMIWLIEMFIVIGLCTYLSLLIQPIQNISCHIYDLLSRIIELSVIYELIIFITKDFDAKKDELLVSKTILLLLLQFIESPTIYIQNTIEEYINNINRKDTLIDKEIKTKLNKCVKNFYDRIYTDEDISNIKSIIIEIDHEYKLEDLSWKNSLLLRWFKR